MCTQLRTLPFSLSVFILTALRRSVMFAQAVDQLLVSYLQKAFRPFRITTSLIDPIRCGEVTRVRGLLRANGEF